VGPARATGAVPVGAGRCSPGPGVAERGARGSDVRERSGRKK
jgi:hypothetical protein